MVIFTKSRFGESRKIVNKGYPGKEIKNSYKMQRENKQNNQKYLYKMFILSLHEILKLVKFHIKQCLKLVQLKVIMERVLRLRTLRIFM